MRWAVEILSASVAGEIAALPKDMGARLARLIGLIQEIGFEALPRDSVKHLEDKLWELRVTARDQAEWNPVSRPDHALNY